MNKIAFKIFLFISLFWLDSPGVAAQSGRQIFPSDKRIQYEGRMGRSQQGATEIYWPGSSIKIRFRGTSLTAVLKDQQGLNYYNVILDDESIRVIRLDSIRKNYLLVSGLPDGNHTVEIFRRNGWPSGITWFYGFEISSGGQILKLAEKKRMIEFYGNSITVGSAMYPENSPDGTENNYKSYAAITARHFHAKYSCIARSGIGLMISWFPLIMADMYNRRNPWDSTDTWHFSGKQPEVVVVNLLQNDYSLFQLPDHPEFIHRFGKTAPGPNSIISSYSNFLQKIRKEYPGASILCVLGNMDACKRGSPWPDYISQAVSSMKDPKIYCHIFSYKNTPGHPNETEQEAMARELIPFISEHTNW